VNVQGDTMRLTISENVKTIVATVLLSCMFLAIAVGCFGFVVFDGNQYDDSYITYRYAVRLAEGKGLTFNNYERINSSSSLIYTILLSGLYQVGFQNLEKVALWIGLVSGILLFILLVQSMKVLAKSVPIILLAGLVFPLTISGQIAGWAVSGMETVFYTALLLGFLYFYLRNALTMSVIFLMLCLSCRPEAVLLYLSVIVAEVIRGRFDNFGRRMPIFIVSGGVVIAMQYIFNYFYYGAFIPHPVEFKRIANYYSPGLMSQIMKLWGFLFYH
jgi:hypothetical protein